MAEKKELAVTEEKVVEIEMERLRSFENHPFKSTIKRTKTVRDQKF